MKPSLLARLDRQFVWHPFTQMRDWVKQDPILITHGKGARLWDSHGRKYLDANSSIWTNLHGHRHPALDRALTKQLKKIAHSSALGLANEPASVLAALLVKAANAPRLPKRLSKVFFSDNGSTAIEVALKLAFEFSRRSRGLRDPCFLSLDGAYHGDTVGAVSMGHIDLFHTTWSKLLFRTGKVMAPYCYRCPFNRASPERADARTYRRCQWECVDHVEQAFDGAKKRGSPYAGFMFEPLIQGAAGMIPQPSGWLRRVAEIARANRSLLIADEVMTGFGRAGTPTESLFACHHEGVQPDLMAVAKGLTGGYLPMAATLTSHEVFNAFLGEYAEFKSFFHGHSYTGNQLGSAVGIESLRILKAADSLRNRRRLQKELDAVLKPLWNLPQVGDIRQVGLVAGIELVRDWRIREPFHPSEQAGIRVCESMARQGVLTRHIGNVVVIMPPYCTTLRQLRTMVNALRTGIEETFSARPGVP